MKKFTLSDDRIVIVKKLEGCLTVIVKQKDSCVKFVEFTPNRCVVLMVLLLLGTTLPCFYNEDHLDPLVALQCRDCHPFSFYETRICLF